jgi:NADH-quinone oxidoreductase subunit A
MTPTAIVAYLVLFTTVGFVFVFTSLLLGRFLRAHSPTPMKLDIYECGEPAIGPGTVQFDLRFYVVALVFLVFEVEVAMFYPTATIFGKAIQMLDPSLNITQETTADQGVPVPIAQSNDTPSPTSARIPASEQRHRQLSPTVVQKYGELGIPAAAMPAVQASSAGAALSEKETRSAVSEEVKSQFHWLALASMIDLGVFFAILLVGFAFVWSRGDLDWVRAVRHPPTPAETIALAQRLRSDLAR